MEKINKKEKWRNHNNGNIYIYDDLNFSDIPILIKEDGIRYLAFCQFETPSNKTWAVLNSFYKKYPKIGLYIIWHNKIDFNFYSKIPSLRDFLVESYLTTDYSPLLQNRELTDLGIGETKSTSIDLSFISKFKKLKFLYIDGIKKGLENASMLSSLEVLALRRVKMNNFDFINNLDNLKQIILLFGSYKNLDAIGNSKKLKTLEINRTAQIPNFDFLNSLNSLNSLYLEGLSKMEKLPNLSGLTNLKRIRIKNNSRLIDVSSLNQLPNLETFLLFFPDRYKATYRKKLLNQSIDFLLNSETVKYTNLFFWLDNQVKERLIEKGIKMWDNK